MKEEEEKKTIERLEAVQPKKKAAEKVGRKSIKNVDNVCSLLTAVTRLQRPVLFQSRYLPRSKKLSLQQWKQKLRTYLVNPPHKRS